MSRGRGLVWLTVYFVVGMLVGWGISEAGHRLGVADGWTLAGVLVLGGFYVWLASRRRYQAWLTGLDSTDDDVWMTTEDVGDARPPREVSS